MIGSFLAAGFSSESLEYVTVFKPVATVASLISHVKSEDKKEHKCNIEDMVQDDDYKLPGKLKMQQLQKV